MSVEHNDKLQRMCKSVTGVAPQVRCNLCYVFDDDDVSSDGVLKDMGDRGGYSPPATASNWENGGSLLGEDIWLPVEDGSGG